MCLQSQNAVWCGLAGFHQCCRRTTGLQTLEGNGKSRCMLELEGSTDTIRIFDFKSMVQNQAPHKALAEEFNKLFGLFG